MSGERCFLLAGGAALQVRLAHVLRRSLEKPRLPRVEALRAGASTSITSGQHPLRRSSRVGRARTDTCCDATAPPDTRAASSSPAARRRPASPLAEASPACCPCRPGGGSIRLPQVSRIRGGESPDGDRTHCGQALGRSPPLDLHSSDPAQPLVGTWGAGTMRRLPLGRSRDQAAQAHLVEVDGDHVCGICAHVEHLVGEHVRAVRVGQRETEDAVLDVVLVVAGLSEPGCEVAAGVVHTRAASPCRCP